MIRRIMHVNTIFNTTPALTSSILHISEPKVGCPLWKPVLSLATNHVIIATKSQTKTPRKKTNQQQARIECSSKLV